MSTYRARIEAFQIIVNELPESIEKLYFIESLKNLRKNADVAEIIGHTKNPHFLPGSSDLNNPLRKADNFFKEKGKKGSEEIYEAFKKDFHTMQNLVWAVLEKKSFEFGQEVGGRIHDITQIIETQSNKPDKGREAIDKILQPIKKDLNTIELTPIPQKHEEEKLEGSNEEKPPSI